MGGKKRELQDDFLYAEGFGGEQEQVILRWGLKH